jgi:hypothetical protein
LSDWQDQTQGNLLTILGMEDQCPNLDTLP